MNRIATRAMAMLVLVLVLVGGIGFFLGEYFAKAEEWVLFSGSPHVYSNGRLGTGVITDRSGVILVDLTDGRSYTGDPLLRKAMLHWVGDRQGTSVFRTSATIPTPSWAMIRWLVSTGMGKTRPRSC